MEYSSLIKKLRIKPGMHMIVLNPPQSYIELLGDLPESVTVAEKLEGQFDFIHLFVRHKAELENLAPAAIKALNHDALLWFSYPKRSSKVETDITRDQGWDAVDQLGYRPVTQISIDKTWSALRFRKKELVGK